MKKEFIIERQGKSFVLYAGLLEEAHSQGLREISTTLLQVPSPDNGQVAICQAVVETERGRYTGIGDASPENVSPLMRVHLIRMAETRAKARALRDAVNVGVAALEELADDGDGPIVAEPEPAYQDLGPVSLSNDRPAARHPITEKQLKAIYAIAQSQLGLSRSEVESRCRDMYGCGVQELSRQEASELIDLLKQDKVA